MVTFSIIAGVGILGAGLKVAKVFSDLQKDLANLDIEMHFKV